MFYWVINYGFYRITRIFAQEIFSRRGVWNVAQSHALSVLELEQFGWMSRIVPATELEVQQWFLEYHPTALLFLNRVYALMHIPSTVGFIAWYYYVSPTFTSFAIARRTMALTNFLAFTIFTLYPCMPPRLLPPEYGFVDTVRHDNAQSVWMRGDYVNSLAAMPSMHFGYSLVLGATVVYHFGLSRDAVTNGGASSLRWLRAVCLMLGLMYPALILITIVATANHYWLDAIAAFGVVCLAFVFNRVLLCLLPVEDVLLWLLRLEKPTPTTGERFRRAKGWRLGFQGERV
ncbi:MAG: hypothetical protein M1817_001289 [Caeruleum heppii]|nr:MAG: hypothetical protein M1817_001289 [Caeruleum heppii]